MIISKKELETLRTKFPVGTMVQLDKMDDIQAPPIGTTGRVAHVDDVGTVFVHWSNGSGLGVVYGVDRCTIVEEAE